jgi:hypothetical protein
VVSQQVRVHDVAQQQHACRRQPPVAGEHRPDDQRLQAVMNGRQRQPDPDARPARLVRVNQVRFIHHRCDSPEFPGAHSTVVVSNSSIVAIAVPNVLVELELL